MKEVLEQSLKAPIRFKAGVPNSSLVVSKVLTDFQERVLGKGVNSFWLRRRKIWGDGKGRVAVNAVSRGFHHWGKGKSGLAAGLGNVVAGEAKRLNGAFVKEA